ncbi:MAG: KEOPS complex subunit Pcc1 [Candidatus Thorarchaeota archaeon]
MRANIDIEFDSTDDAEQIRKTITPDNTPVPEGIEIDTKVIGATLKVVIKCNRGIDSFRATIEDIMSAIDLSIRTQKTVE